MSETASSRLRRLIEQHREEIRAIAARHGASNLRLFGSVIHGDATPESDVDLLVTMEPGRSGFEFVRLQLELEALLRVRIDLVEDRALHRLIREDVLREAVPV